MGVHHGGTKWRSRDTGIKIYKLYRSLLFSDIIALKIISQLERLVFS